MTPKLKAWAEAKAPFLANRNFIPVGRPGGGSRVISPNPMNRFWGITVRRINANMGGLFEKYLTDIIKKS